MSYTPIYTSEADIERYLSITITTATTPTTAQTLDFIEEVETGMLKEGWGTQTAGSGTYLTVYPTRAVSKGTVAWAMEGYPQTEQGRLVVPPYRPIQSVTSGSFFRNLRGLADAPSMELLKCKDNLPNAASTDFMIVKKYNQKTGNYDGVSFYFYNDIPYAGERSVCGGWVYGYNISSAIRQEYATLKTCEKIILARLFGGNPTNLASFTGGDTAGYVNTQYREQIDYIRERCEEIKKAHLPDPLPIAAIQGI